MFFLVLFKDINTIYRYKSKNADFIEFLSVFYACQKKLK